MKKLAKSKVVDSLKVGDVFRCADKKIANGQRDLSMSKTVTVGHYSHPHIVHEFKKCKHCGGSGKKTVATRKYDAYDRTRMKSLWVVERAETEGGGTGHGPHDVYPDGLNITARCLGKRGGYDPKGEVIDFYMSGSFNCMLEKVTLVGRMEKSFA